MSRLITPVQFEPVLGELNQLRPLKLKKLVRQKIVYPVIDANNSDTSTRGKLLRCNEGSTLVNPPQTGYETYEVILDYYREYLDYTYVPVTFSQQVKFVLIYTYNVWFYIDVQWVSGNGGFALKDITQNGVTECGFKGTTFWLGLHSDLDGWMVMQMYGFY